MYVAVAFRVACVLRGLSLPVPAKGFTTTALRATLADALMTETLVQAKAEGQVALRRKRKIQDVEEAEREKARYGMHVNQKLHVRRKRGEKRNAGLQVQLQLALGC
jgi:hypothetical protein